MASSKKRSWTPMQRKNFMAAIAKRKAQRAKMPEIKAPDPDHIPDEIDTSQEVSVRWYQERIAELEEELKFFRIKALEAMQCANSMALKLLKGEKL